MTKQRYSGIPSPHPEISPMAIQAMSAHDPRLMTGGHGHVIPRPDASKAPCGGATQCRECYLEFVALKTTDRVMVWEGFNLKPGDKLLLIAPMGMPGDVIAHYGRQLKLKFPDVDVCIVQGFTGVQVYRQEPNGGVENS